jgi:hypothetical protein
VDWMHPVQEMDSYKQGNERSSSIKGVKYLDWPSDY